MKLSICTSHFFYGVHVSLSACVDFQIRDGADKKR